MKNQKGVMLIETLVALIVSTVVGMVIFSIFFMYNNQSNQSIASFIMQQQYDNVSCQIARDVRCASYVLAQGETIAAHSAGYDTVSSIEILNASGQVIAKYAINADRLLSGSQMVAYEAGGDPVKLVQESSFFVLNPERKRVQAQLAISRTMGCKTHTVSPRKDLFVCRN